MEDLKSQLGFLRESEVKDIIEEGKKQAAQIIAEAHTKADEMKKREIEQIRANIGEIEIRELEAAKSEQKRRMMNLKIQLIEAAFAASLDTLKQMVNEQVLIYRNSLESLIVEATSQMTGSQFEVILSSKDAEFVRKKLKRIEQEISTIRNISITLGISNEPLRSIGGVVVRSSDGKQVFNNTLEARLAKVRQENLPEIAKILFEGTDA